MGSPHQTEKIVRQVRKFQGAVSTGISGCVRKRGGSKRVPDYQLPEKRRSNEVLRRRLCSAVSKYLGHFPEGLIEFHILIDALDCPALGHAATVRAAAGTVALTTTNDVFLDTVQRGPKIFGSVSITSWIKEHGGTYRGFREVFPAINRRASGQS